jgi:hypothetical protein
VLSATAALAGTFQGVITDAAGNPLGGAQVINFLDKNGDGSYKYVTTSNADGTYAVQFDNNNPGFIVYKDGYAMPVRFQEDGINSAATVTQNWALKSNSFAAVHDQFSSAGGAYGLGTTDDAAHYSWQARTAGASVSGGTLNINHNNGVVIFDKSNGQYFAPNNFDFTASFKTEGAVSYQTMLWRMPTASGGVSDYNSCAFLFILPDGRLFTGMNNYSPWQVQLADLPDIDLSVYHTWRVVVNGYNLQVHMDGVKVADKFIMSGVVGEVGYTPWPPPMDTVNVDPVNDGYDVVESWYSDAVAKGGFLGFQSFGTGTMMVDWVNVTTVPEPSAIIALLSGMVGLVGFARRRRA